MPKLAPDDEVLVKAFAVNSEDARLRALRVLRGMGVLMRMRFGFFQADGPVAGVNVAGRVEPVGTTDL